MTERTTTNDSRSSFGRLVALALAFVLGYVIGSRSLDGSDEWREAPTEPTQITIEDETSEERRGSEE